MQASAIRLGPFLDVSLQDELRLVTPFATSRAQSMNSWATGLRVRFLNVMTPIGRRVVGRSTGRTLRFVLPEPNLTIEAWTMLRNRPLASRALRTGVEVLKTVARGTLSPAARKASAATEPYRLSKGDSTHSASTNSARRIFRRCAHLLLTPATTTSGSS